MALDQGPTLAELRTRLQALGYATDSAAQQTIALNAAQRRITGLRRWSFQELTLNIDIQAGDVDFDLDADYGSPPTPFDKIDAVHVLAGPNQEDRLRITPEDPETFELRQWEYQGATGTPLYWCRRGSFLEWAPATDTTYVFELDVVQFNTPMVADGDRTMIPATYADAVVWGAASWLAHRQRDRTSADFAEAQFASILRSMISAYVLPHRQGQGHVVRSPHWTNLGGGTVQWRG